MSKEFSLPAGAPDLGTSRVTDATAQRMLQAGNEIDQLANALKSNLIQGYTNGYAVAWKQATGLTPRQFFKAIGNKGAAFLVRGAALRKFINEQFPDELVPGIPDNYQIDMGSDGTVIVSEK